METVPASLKWLHEYRLVKASNMSVLSGVARGDIRMDTLAAKDFQAYKIMLLK